MVDPRGPRRLVSLGSGVYTVAEVCHVLQPTMTPRKVHYWLNTGILSEAVRPGSKGYPTLLSYRQLLEIRTVQHLRDELEFSLPHIREALRWILDHLFAAEWTELKFAKGINGSLVVRSANSEIVVPGGQGVIEGTLGQLTEQLTQTRNAWERQTFEIPGHRFVVLNANILAGAPTIRGTRIDTAVLARFVESASYDNAAIAEITRAYPTLLRDAVEEALIFEGIHSAA